MKTRVPKYFMLDGTTKTGHKATSYHYKGHMPKEQISALENALKDKNKTFKLTRLRKKDFWK